MYSTTTQALNEKIFAFMVFMWVILIIFGIISYVFTSIAWMTMAKNKGVENPWMAWIPVARYYTLGELLSDNVGGNGAVKFLVIYAAATFLSMIPFVGPFAALAVGVFSIFAMYWLFDKYSERATMHTILSILLAFTIIGIFYYPIAIFVLRNRPARK